MNWETLMSEKSFNYLLTHTDLNERLDAQEKNYVIQSDWKSLWQSIMFQHEHFIQKSIIQSIKERNTKLTQAWSSLLYMEDHSSSEIEFIANVIEATDSFEERLELAKNGLFIYRGRISRKNSPSFQECQWMFLTHIHELEFINRENEDTRKKLDTVIKKTLENVDGKPIPLRYELAEKIFELLNNDSDKTNLFLAANTYPDFQKTRYASQSFGNIKQHMKNIDDLCIQDATMSLNLSNIFPINDCCFLITALVIKNDKENVAREWLDTLTFWKNHYVQNQHAINSTIEIVQHVFELRKNTTIQNPLVLYATLSSKEGLLTHMLEQIESKNPDQWWSSVDTTQSLDLDTVSV